MKFNTLTPEEKRVIEDKGTEAPFSGEYETFDGDGVYVCRRCNAKLYRSENKFDARCGWPSFDDEIPGSVTRTIDADGLRTEITCARCDAHLGHVFEGEHFTEKDTRHCVNSLSLRFIPRQQLADTQREIAYIGGGCFWCTEATFSHIRGVLSVTPGYAGGIATSIAPTYEEVSSGSTEHAEVVRIEFDSARISYEMILTLFFASHDPTTLNRQGADTGTQYRSIILATNDIQREIAEKTVAKLEKEHIFDAPIVTEIKPLETFYEAEDYHKRYFENHPEAAYCQAVIAPKIAKLTATFKELMK